MRLRRQQRHVIWRLGELLRHIYPCSRWRQCASDPEWRGLSPKSGACLPGLLPIINIFAKLLLNKLFGST